MDGVISHSPWRSTGCWLLAVLCACWSLLAAAGSPDVEPITPAPTLNSNETITYWYRNYDLPSTYALLQMALAMTEDLYGPTQIKRSTEISQGRALAALADHHFEQVSVMNVVVDEHREEASSLIPIPIATDQGLFGYRICIIQKKNLPLFENINSHLDVNARGIVFGQGAHWPDTRILQANQLRVVTSARYENLFDMLKGGRFNCFLRGANEVVDDLAYANDPNLIIEPNLAFVYPSAALFFVNKADVALAARIELGLRRAILSGAYAQFLREHYAKNLELLNIDQRRIIRLNNPLIDHLGLYQTKDALLSEEGKINY
ncbi:hypothetical protein [Halioxenophilus sp. WMMB6]|uniref:hypothetical protein n=1 Tax=Halioxenophilus sp. WMMB6 TaxID=3073815 RepID=UPI00295EFEDA|nr:hypothetical protein [Halioxenophilus sp. WMMB6]